ncbi:hypothetical protein [Microbispora sp. NPDC049125]|uniref:hypothetical protein n=1 Tax=Microbispora sp. NPDC049125 TaxID=3154929 RepID=UPI003465744E
MSAHRPARDDAGTMPPPHPLRHAGTEDDTRYVRMAVKLTAMIGGPFFLLTVILHPARDGHDIAAGAQWYAFTHSMEAISLLVQATCLAGVLALVMNRFGSRGLTTLYTALVGTMLWFGLIVFDGGHNPVTAKYAPDLVHTSKDIDIEGGIIVLAANIVFPLGYVLLALLLNRYGQRWTGLLLGFGGVVYAIGGTVSLFGFGPHSMITSVIEIIGAAPYALGYVLLGRTFGQARRLST